MLALGFLSGDGTIAGDKTVVYFTPEKDGDFVREEVLPVLSDLAGDEGEVDYMPAPSGTSSAYELCRVGLSRWLVDIGMDTRPLPERRLPPFVWRAKLGAQRAFLRGLYAANGCVIHTARQAVNLTSTCAGLLRDVQLLLAVFGIRGTIRVQNKAQEIAWSNGTYRSKEAYRLEITAWSDIFRFARLIGFPQSVQEAKLRKIIDLGPLTSRYGGETRQATLEVASGEVNAAEVYAVIVTDCTRLMVDGVLLQSMPARPGAAPGLVRNGKELPFNPDRPPVPPSGPRRAT